MTSRNDPAIAVDLDMDPLDVGNLSLDDDYSLIGGDTTVSSPDRPTTSTTSAPRREVSSPVVTRASSTRSATTQQVNSFTTTSRSSMGSSRVGGTSPRAPGGLTGACTRNDGKKFFLLPDEAVCDMTCGASIGNLGTASARFCCETKKSAEDIGCKAHNKTGKGKSTFHTLSPQSAYAPAKTNRGRATAYILPSLKYSLIDRDVMDTLQHSTFSTSEAVDLINHINVQEEERKLAEAQLEDERNNGYDVVEDTLLDEDNNLLYDHASIEVDESKIPTVVFAEIPKDDSAKSWVEPLHDLQSEVQQVGEGLLYVKTKLAETGAKVEEGAKSTLARVVDVVVETHHELSELKIVLGNVDDIVESHASVSHALERREESVDMLKTGLDFLTKDTKQLLTDSQTQAVNLKALKGSAGNAIKTLSKNTKTKFGEVSQRLRVLESVSGVSSSQAQASAVESPGVNTSAGGTSGVSTPARRGGSWSGGGSGAAGDGGYGGSNGTDLNTVLGYDERRGGRPVTVNTMLADMTQLSAQTSILLDRTSSAGAGAGKFWWPSKSDFQAHVMKELPSGTAACAFLDVCSLFTHASFGENDPVTWLQEYANSTKAGFQSRLYSRYANTFCNRFPGPLIGTAKSVLPGTTLHFLGTVATWRGDGGSDGKREQLLKALNLGYEHARQYAREALPPGELQDLALYLASESMAFITSLFNYLEDEITKLIGIGIPSKSVMLLASNQVMHIFESFYDVRQHARETANGSQVDLFISQVWATLKCHKVMNEYTKLRFKHHPAVASAYMRFLTQETGANSSAVLAKKLNELASKQDAIKEALVLHGKDVKRVESMLNTIITANNLKRK